MTEGYIERGSIPHRFLILELHHNAWGPAWLRLDRRRSPEGKILKFLLASSTSPACDGVSSIDQYIIELELNFIFNYQGASGR